LKSFVSNFSSTVVFSQHLFFERVIIMRLRNDFKIIPNSLLYYLLLHSLIVSFFKINPIYAEGSVTIPLSVVGPPARDLRIDEFELLQNRLHRNNPLNSSPSDKILPLGDATQISRSNLQRAPFERSDHLIDPANNKIWQIHEYPASSSASNNGNGTFPEQNGKVRFIAHEATNTFTYMGRVQNINQPNEYYRFTISRYTHATLLRSALLRKLGYYVPSPQYYRQLNLHLASQKEMDDFISYTQKATNSDFFDRKWITKKDDKNWILTFTHVVLEPAQSDYYDGNWGYAPHPHHHAVFLQKLSQHRAFRALIIPYVLTDIPESFNRYSPRAGSIKADSVVLNHPSAASFAACTAPDARWILEKMGEFQESDWNEIIASANLPSETHDLIKAKLLHRLDNLYKLFQLTPKVKLVLPPLRINSPSGLVVNGKVTREYVAGLPVRIAHGDRDSPFKDGDMQRYLTMSLKASVIKTALDKINDKLIIRGTEHAVKKRREEVLNKVRQHIKENPQEPLYQSVESWGGPLASLSINADRYLATGTYFDSQAPIQLVDTMSYGGSVGYFRAWDGFAPHVPTAVAQFSMQRSYIHVRPLASIEEGTKVSWLDMYTPRFMNGLAELLAEKKGEVAGEAFDRFMQELKPGEVITITDSFGATASLQRITPISYFMDVKNSINSLQNIVVGVKGSYVILKQTSIVRTKKGIQVFIRTFNKPGAGTFLDVNYFIKLFSLRLDTTNADIKTDAFLIDYNAELATQVDSTQNTDFIEKRKQLRDSFEVLIKDNDPELFYSYFKGREFKITHDLRTTSAKMSLLFIREMSFDETHEVTIQYPPNPDHPHLDPTSEGQLVRIYAHTKGSLSGRNPFELIGDIAMGFLDTFGIISRNEDPNPANIPFGSAEWKILSVERDLSKNDPYPQVGKVDEVWGGWHLDRHDLIRLLRDINYKFEDVPAYRPIQMGVFATVESIDFYRITAHLSIFESGLKKLNRLFTPSQRKNEDYFLEQIVALLRAENNMWDCSDTVEKISRFGHTVWPPVDPRIRCVKSWYDNLLFLRKQRPKNPKQKVDRLTNILNSLEEKVSKGAILWFLGKKNYLFFIRINGFRKGDEDGDLELVFDSHGKPTKKFPEANGARAAYAREIGISPAELNRSNGGFR